MNWLINRAAERWAERVGRSKIFDRWATDVVEGFVRGARARGWRIVKIDPNLVPEMDEWITDELTEDDLDDLRELT